MRSSRSILARLLSNKPTMSSITSIDTYTLLTCERIFCSVCLWLMSTIFCAILLSITPTICAPVSATDAVMLNVPLGFIGITVPLLLSPPLLGIDIGSVTPPIVILSGIIELRPPPPPITIS